MKNLLDLSPTFTEGLSNQKIIYTARKHWISFVIPIFLMVIGIVGVLPVFLGIGFVRLIGFGLLYLFFKGLIALLKKISTKIYLTEDHITIS